MLMNFGPINQKGGEKRLNVIFSRAKQHMAIVSSIHHQDITNDYNDGANSLKQFLQYAEAVSNGDAGSVRRVLENLNPLARKGLAPISRDDAVVNALAAALRSRGYEVDLNVGQSRFRCDLAVRSKTENLYQLGILVDTEGHYANPNLLDRYLMQPSILRTFGWRVAFVLTKDWYHNPDDVIARLEKILKNPESPELEEADEEDAAGIGPESSMAKGGEQRASVDADARTQSKKPAGTKQSTRIGSGATRRFELVRGTSRKFWEITLNESSFSVRFGRIGSEGVIQSKTLADARKAAAEVAKLIAEKQKKGYEEVE